MAGRIFVRHLTHWGCWVSRCTSLLCFFVFCFGPTISATWDHNSPCHFTVLPPLFLFFPSLSPPLLIVWVGCLFPRPAPGRCGSPRTFLLPFLLTICSFLLFFFFLSLFRSVFLFFVVVLFFVSGCGRRGGGGIQRFSMASGLLLPLREALLWSLVFVLCGAPVAEAHTAVLTFAFGLLLSLTMPMELKDIRQTLLADVNGISALENFFKKREGNHFRMIETLLLLTAILSGAVFTQLDWDVWFQAWPFPAVMSFALMRALLQLVGLPRRAQGNMMENVIINERELGPHEL
ncbi:hypothetical protein, conserved [Trypanosoma cruzi]|uniref:Uncharacterized protein n=2 Tax=Trypanosoma cruzi TaxID=5693 RepID=Q4DCA0_TRYCC|nr:hypothetical protein, conserved [Trypanosoma cruzi]EAN90144.1 hypothetical protein, conserved [Trypanosoma cruzi]|eukprot:XP_811995.1 hypothetical protein [Trypanosoma cruzi strain CL Brener]